jgi:hypothetical protein
VVLQQLPVGRRPVLAPLIGVDQELVGFDLALPQSPIQGLQHQRRFYGGAYGPADHTAAVQIDPDSQVTPICTPVQIGDVTSPSAVECKGQKMVLHEVLGVICGPAAAVAAGPQMSPGFGLEHGPAH